MISIDAVEPAFRKMPPELQRRVLRYIESLSGRAGSSYAGSMRFSWAGCCPDLKSDYTSIQLQKKIPDWWG